MIAISVVIITYNEERNLDRCLASIKDIADEIIVVDSLSTDNTAALAASYGARVIEHPFTGYIDQKNFATQQASNNWILSLDADEALSPELMQSITEIKKQPTHNAYRIKRLTNYCGQWIRHCGWYPDKQLRLYDRTKGNWHGEQVHEYWQLTDAEGKIGQLTGDLLHYSFYTVSEHLKKIERYTEMAARAAVAKGKKASLFKIWISPKWHFFTEYFIRLGFLDGFYGYTICKLSSYSAFIKYSKIRLYQRDKEL